MTTQLSAHDEALQRRLDEYRAERDAALAREAALAEVLQTINASPGNLAPVFDAILEKAHKLCEIDYGSLELCDGDQFRTVAVRGLSDAFADQLRQGYAASESPATRPLLAGDRFTLIADAADVDFPVFRSAAELEGIRTVLFVPLRKDDLLLGMIASARREVRLFSEREIALLENFAAQAVIAMENARLITEQREALEQQTATAEVLQAINASPGDLAPVFEAILEKSMRLCEAAFGSLYTYDGERFHSAAQRGVPPAYAAFREQNPPNPAPDNRFAQAIETRRTLQILDLKAEKPYLDGNPNSRAMVELGGIRTILSVPLCKDDTLLGIIAVFRQDVRAFSGKQIELLENFAAQAVIAMENARLLRELQQRTGDLQESLDYQTATSEVLKVISGSGFELEPVFRTVAATAARLCHADEAGIYLDRGGEYRWAGGYSQSPEYERIERAVGIRPDTGTLVGRVALEARPVHILDAWTDPLYTARDDARVGGIHTLLGVPLLRDGSPIGVIGLGRRIIEPFTDRQIELVSTFADQAVIAMENARLLGELQQRTGDLQQSLDYQTATSEVLKVISRSTFDLQPVLETVARTAALLCDAEMSMVGYRSGDLWRPAANFGYPPEYEAYERSRGLMPVDAGSPSVGWRAIREARVVHVADVAAVPGYHEASVKLARQRTTLGVPMLRDGEVTGVIMLARQRVQPFTPQQIELVTTFADQGAIAIENTRLLTQQQEALERQTATAEVLQVINANPGNLALVFHAVLERALQLCAASFGTLLTYDGERIERVALLGLPPAFAEWSRRNPLTKDAGLISRGIATRKPVQATDVTADAFLSSGVRDALVELGGVRALLQVPLLKDEAVVGFIAIFRREPGTFPDRQVALLEGFAAQAVIAMENARLLTEQREALEQQTAVADVLQVINASPGNLAPVFDVILEKAVSLCEASLGVLHRYDGGTMLPLAARGPLQMTQAVLRTPLMVDPGTAVERLLHGEGVVHIADITDTDTYRAGIPSRVKLVEMTGARTALWVALRKDALLIGTLVIYRTQVRPFADKEIALVENFAAQAVIAMENARLLEEIRQRQEELRITFENMGDGVAMFDETPRLVAWNRKFQELLDVPDDILAKRQSYADYIRYLTERGEYGPGVDPEAQLRFFQERSGEHYAFERTRPDGRIIEVRHNPVPGGGFVLIFADITERKRNEAEIRAARDAAEAAYRELKAAQANLVQAEKMASLGQLTAGIAHEIKNPLNFVNNFSLLSVELLNELKQGVAPVLPSLGTDKRAEIDEVVDMLSSNMEKITEHGRRADGIVRSMLEHSRSESGERRPVDVNTLVEDALNLAYHGARAQDQGFNITLERDLAAGIAPIELAPQDMTRVLLNLFANGFYAARKRQRSETARGFEPTLRLTTRDAGDAVEIEVRDNGIGIPLEIRDRLFQPFFTTKPTGEGTGLGLSISYDIVTQGHGGSITVDSAAGEYSAFTIRIPRDRPR